jgi:hypothetical protein
MAMPGSTEIGANACYADQGSDVLAAILSHISTQLRAVGDCPPKRIVGERLDSRLLYSGFEGLVAREGAKDGSRAEPRPAGADGR